MSEPPTPTGGAEPGGQVAGDPRVDDRLAAVLRGDTTSQALRHQLVSETGDESEDLLGRLDALEFVNQVVGDTSEVPDRIAEYEIKGLLGRGGMGTVYLAWQKELERKVALKVLSSNYSADPTMRKRFRAEARATAALHHRHIVPIYDYGEAHGMLFFTMEHVDGMSLDKHITACRRLRRPPMQPLEAANRFAGVADALGLAHRRRLLHRDVKPGNLLVAGDGTLALTDFGLAKAIDQVSARLTSKSGGFLGTLHYSSPEQALGDDLTPASDLYAFGVTMFEAITGQLPFAAKTTEALLQAILHGTPRRLRELVPRAPRDLDAVLEKLLSREPGDRYQDGEAVARDLLRIRDGEPVHIRRLPLHVRVYRRARKNPGLFSAIAAACVLLFVTVALTAGLWRVSGESLASRHENHLVQIAAQIGNEHGPDTGPAPLLQALTGLEYPATEPNSEVMRALEAAHREVPDDGKVLAMQRSYAIDPLEEASVLLREGRGFEALKLLEVAIADAEVERYSPKHKLAVELKLYRLYASSGVANLCAAVGRANDARVNLALASYMRPGAVFPRALVDVLDVAQSSNVGKAAETLEREIAEATESRVEVIGHLLWSVAGLRPLKGANLMRFQLNYTDRRVLHQFALRLLGEPPSSACDALEPTGLCVPLAGFARDALGELADPAALRSVTEAARTKIATWVDPGSPLQGWAGVLQLLEQPMQRGPLVDDVDRELSPALQLAAWDCLLHLAPESETMALWAPRFDYLHSNHANLEGVLRTAARVHLFADSPNARKLINEWIAAAEGDPEARLCRMQLRLRRSEFDGALDDAMVAVQESVDPVAALEAVQRVCELAAGECDEASRAAILDLQQKFGGLDVGPPDDPERQGEER